MNSADRVIRVFDIDDILGEEDGEVEALQRLQDLVNRYVRGRGKCVIHVGRYICMRHGSSVVA